MEWQIAVKELLPILFAMVLWGKCWSGKRVECQCDNMAVVGAIFMVAAYHDIQIHATHLPGVENIAADSLSRNNLPTFLQAVPDTATLPTPIPQALVDMVVRESPDWSSPRWAQLFSAFCKQA